MKFLIDMVHHNPGDPPFKTMFLDPMMLASLGYGGQTFKHLNCAVRFDALGYGLFRSGTPEGIWMESLRNRLRSEILRAKKAGLLVFYHIDLFVLPTELIRREKTAILDEANRISFDCERTREIHRILLSEMFHDFPDVDGVIVRTGETYLMDTPFHTGNGPVYNESAPRNISREKAVFRDLLNFLREEICVRHDRWLIYRTWDTFRDRFHASAEYYLDVTDDVKPHQKLIFSIKHTQLDFFRRVPFNPALGKGNHLQIVEIQCQREFEGKGAHPNYVVKGIIEGFEEEQGPGLRSLVRNPRFAGVYSWSRGGGWYGPYIQNEFWCELNVRVLASWLKNPEQNEAEVFSDCARQLGIGMESISLFRELCEMSATAVLKGRYCSQRELNMCWMRDEHIGGMNQLRDDFEWMHECNLLESALVEKEEAVALWREMERISNEIQTSDIMLTDFIRVSTSYGRILYSIVWRSWQILIFGLQAEHQKQIDSDLVDQAFRDYDELWEEFYQLKKKHPQCATCYRPKYWNWPGEELAPGIGASVERYRQSLS